MKGKPNGSQMEGRLFEGKIKRKPNGEVVGFPQKQLAGAISRECGNEPSPLNENDKEWFIPRGSNSMNLGPNSQVLRPPNKRLQGVYLRVWVLHSKVQEPRSQKKPNGKEDQTQTNGKVVCFPARKGNGKPNCKKPNGKKPVCFSYGKKSNSDFGVFQQSDQCRRACWLV